jgi:hypothetical protein
MYKNFIQHSAVKELHMQRKLLIISMDFYTTGQLPIIYSAFVKYLKKKKWEYSEAVHQLFVDFRSEVLYNTLFEYIPIKLVKLIKMCLNETSSRVQVGEHLFDMFPVEKFMKQECRRRVFENRVKWRYRSTHSYPWHYLKASGQFNAMTALPPSESPPFAQCIGDSMGSTAGLEILLPLLRNKP